jgi:hypothetical protein
MPLPVHALSFRRFSENIPDHLTASVAFGLFMQSEGIWIAEQNPEPTETRCRNYHRNFLNEHEIQRYKQAAEVLLNNFANGVISTKREEFLTQALQQYQSSARVGHRGFRYWGIVEATIGALVWSILLIVVYVIVAEHGIDILDLYRKATGR